MNVDRFLRVPHIVFDCESMGLHGEAFAVGATPQRPPPDDGAEQTRKAGGTVKRERKPKNANPQTKRTLAETLALGEKHPMQPTTTRLVHELVRRFQAAPTPALLVFTAAWCGPCRVMKPALAKLAASGMPVIYVDVDDLPKVAAEYEVAALPTIFVLRAGVTQHERIVGTRTEKTLRELVATAKSG